MKKALVFTFAIVLVCICFFPGTGLGQAQTGQPFIGPITEAGFLETFLKTPFVFFTSIFTFVSCVISAFFEFWVFLFSLASYKFTVTREIAHMGWKNIAYHWWWQPGIGWHLAISILFWMGALSRAKR
jgi:hypothetical protein